MSSNDNTTPHDINPLSMMRAKQVLELVPFGRASLWRFAKNDQFSAPIRVTGGITAWGNKDVVEWSQAQSATNNEEV